MSILLIIVIRLNISHQWDAMFFISLMKKYVIDLRKWGTKTWFIHATFMKSVALLLVINSLGSYF